MNLGKIIRHLREQREWSQDELAFRVDTSAANISRIETGKHWPGTKLLSDLAATLGLKVYQLIALAEGIQLGAKSGKYEYDEEVLLKHFRTMPKEQRELFKAIGATFAKVRSRVTAK